MPKERKQGEETAKETAAVEWDEGGKKGEEKKQEERKQNIGEERKGQ